jgi:predicted O-methyltransferase YrrM
MNNGHYSTHLPLLRFLLEEFDVKSVLELGIGDFSTVFFMDVKLDKLVCVESDGGYTRKFSKKAKPHHTFVTHQLLPYTEKDFYFDLAFVDGNPAHERGS